MVLNGEGQEWQRPPIECLGNRLVRHTRDYSTPRMWLSLRIVARWNIASPGVNIVNFIKANNVHY